MSTDPVFPPLVLEQGDDLCNSGAPPSYATFELIVGLDESTVLLVEGETKALSVDGGPQADTYQATNLTSFAEAIDGPFHLAFAVTRD